jgi:hypothetical protein
VLGVAGSGKRAQRPCSGARGGADRKEWVRARLRLGFYIPEARVLGEGAAVRAA